MHLTFLQTNDSYSAIWGGKYLMLTDGKRMTLINTQTTRRVVGGISPDFRASSGMADVLVDRPGSPQ